MPTYLEKIEALEEGRNTILRAERQALKHVYNENFSGKERVLEIGCGTGFLKRNMPQYGEWVQLDANKDLLKRAKKLNPQGDYVLGSAYALPFANSTFDAVAGFNSFDVFEQIDKAIGETRRTLKPNGLFLHMLDVHPAETLILRELDKNGVDYMADLSEGPEVTRSEKIYFIPEENRERFEAEEDFHEEDSVKTLKRLTEIFVKHSKVISLEERFKHFERIMTSELRPHFEDVNVGSIIQSYEGRRLEFQKGYGYGNLFSISPSLRAQTKLAELKKGIQYIFYKIVKPISPNFAGSIEPSCTEICEIKYIKARKPQK